MAVKYKVSYARIAATKDPDMCNAFAATEYTALSQDDNWE
jgi:hypothetical protein